MNTGNTHPDNPMANGDQDSSNERSDNNTNIVPLEQLKAARGNPEPLTRSASALEEEKQRLHEKLRLQLSCALQTSLETENILRLYHQIISAVVDLAGIEYLGANSSQAIALGSKSPHTLNYQLDTGVQEVGEITYYCKTRIHGLSLETLEIATSTIVYPMHNAAQFAEARTLAHEDPLTGLGNRRALENHLTAVNARTQRQGSNACIMMIDIDHFKKINDQFGHGIGDKVLCRIASSLALLSRDTDKVFRFGGEEFVCILDDTNLEGAGLAAERFVAHIASLNLQDIHPELCHCDWTADNCSPTVSIGFTEINPEESAEKLFVRADSAMYQAKEQGRNQSVGLSLTMH